MTYSVSNGNLIESDTGTTTTTSTLVTGVTSFSVKLSSTTSPVSAQISITAGTVPSVTRTVTLYCRNL